jgi:hypothetical protein
MIFKSISTTSLKLELQIYGKKKHKANSDGMQRLQPEMG